MTKSSNFLEFLNLNLINTLNRINDDSLKIFYFMMNYHSQCIFVIAHNTLNIYPKKIINEHGLWGHVSSYKRSMFGMECFIFCENLFKLIMQIGLMIISTKIVTLDIGLNKINNEHCISMATKSSMFGVKLLGEYK